MYIEKVTSNVQDNTRVIIMIALHSTRQIVHQAVACDIIYIEPFEQCAGRHHLMSGGTLQYHVYGKVPVVCGSVSDMKT